MNRVGHELYAEQDGSVSKLVLKIDGDEPIVLLQYDRGLLERTKDASAILLCSEGRGAVESFVGVQIILRDGVQSAAA